MSTASSSSDSQQPASPKPQVSTPKHDGDIIDENQVEDSRDYELTPSPARPVFTSQPSASYASGATFHRFRKLPVELRLMIWRYAFPDPREVNLNPPLGICTQTHHGRRIFRCSCINEGCFPLPATLHVNQESRRETLANYRVLTMKDEAQGESKIICFDPARDAPYFYLQDIVDFDDLSDYEFEDMIDAYRTEEEEGLWVNPFRAGNIKDSSWLDGIKVIDIRCWDMSMEPYNAETLQFRPLQMLQNVDQVRLRFSQVYKTGHPCKWFRPQTHRRIMDETDLKNKLCSTLEKNAKENSKDDAISHIPEVTMACCGKQNGVCC